MRILEWNDNTRKLQEGVQVGYRCEGNDGHAVELPEVW
jgi:hypothetical protein